MFAALANRSILLVEDEAVIALAIEDMLTSLGCRIVGPAFTAAAAEKLAECERIDGAVLDINLGGETSDEVARILRERGIPFCFSTGYGSTGVPTDFADVPVLQKPYRTEALGEVLKTIVR